MRLINQAQRITALQQVLVLSGLSRAVLRELARRAEEVNVPKGAFIFRQGDSGKEVYVILDGSFVVRRHARKIDSFKKGEVFGALSLIEDMPRSASVVAVEESVVLVVHRKDFEELLEIPRVAKAVIRALAARLREAEEKILQPSLGGAESATRKPKSLGKAPRKK